MGVNIPVERAFEPVRQAYLESYAPEGVPRTDLESRLTEADVLIRKLVSRSRNWATSYN